MLQSYLADASLDLALSTHQCIVQVGAIDRRGIVFAVPHDLILTLLLLLLLLVLKEAEHCSLAGASSAAAAPLTARRYKFKFKLNYYGYLARTGSFKLAALWSYWTPMTEAIGGLTSVHQHKIPGEQTSRIVTDRSLES